MLIYQVDDGSDNSAKLPLGGIIVQSLASSMLDAIANPITFYGSGSTVINQTGHSKDLYNYYWTSYSRGTDGAINNTSWHNAYLDGYIPLRVKSIYDPCPYLYRIPSNGTWNQFDFNPGWTNSSYLGGVSWNMTTQGESWFLSMLRNISSGKLGRVGDGCWYWSAITVSKTEGSQLKFYSSGIYSNNAKNFSSFGFSVRCIEEFNVTFRTGISATVQHSSCKHDSAFTLHDICSPKRH